MTKRTLMLVIGSALAYACVGITGLSLIIGSSLSRQEAKITSTPARSTEIALVTAAPSKPNATATAQPTKTALPAATPIPTSTEKPASTAAPTVALTDTPAPTETSAPTPTRQPTDTPLPPTIVPTHTRAPVPTATIRVEVPTVDSSPRANANANLRGGPGTEYAAVGSVKSGDPLDVLGQDASGEWLALEGGTWIAAFIVANAPEAASMTVVAGPAVTPVATSPAPEQQPAAAQGQIRITGMLRDGVEGRLEPDEYVEITNAGGSPVDLTGWRLESERRGNDDGQIFYFPGGFVMQPGQVCRVYTNEDHPEWCGLSFYHGSSAVWSNSDPDAALLVDTGGAIVDHHE